MSFFIADAMAATPPATGGPFGAFGTLVPLLLFMAFFYFMIFRPQSKRGKEHKQLLESLAKGDEVVLSSGLLGRVSKVEDNFAVIEISDQVEVKIQKTAVTSTLPKGTLKAI